MHFQRRPWRKRRHRQPAFGAASSVGQPMGEVRECPDTLTSSLVSQLFPTPPRPPPPQCRQQGCGLARTGADWRQLEPDDILQLHNQHSC
jgi:hypothetical protein